MMKNRTLRPLSAVILAAFSASASAAAFQLWEQNASGLGNAYAGSAAVADNASTNFFNPAGLTQLPGTQISLGVSAVGPSYRFRDQGSTGLNANGSTGGDAGGWAAVPNAYFSQQLNERLYFGFGVSAPFGLATEYNAGNWIGANQAVKSEIRTINYNPSLAYRLNDKVSLGFGLNYQTIDAEMTNALAGGYRVKGDDSAFGWNVGALFTLSPAMRLGVSYRSAVDYRLEGTRTLAGVSRNATADIKLPDTFILSVWQQVSDRWEAMGDLSYTRWNTLDKLLINHGGATPDVENFGYRNSWRFAWGAAYRYSDQAKLKFGIAWDRTPVADAVRSPRVPDNDRLWLSLGGQWKLGQGGRLDVGYSYLYVKDPTLSQSRNGTSLSGRYDASAHIVGAQYSLGF